MSLRRKNLIGLVYLAPALLFVAVFVLYPFCQLVYTSFTDASLLGGGQFVGWANYQAAFKEATFWKALTFNVSYVDTDIKRANATVNPGNYRAVKGNVVVSLTAAF